MNTFSRYVKRNTKGPTDRVDYTFDFTSVLPVGDTVSTYTYGSDGGLGLSNASQSGAVITVRASGGQGGRSYDAYVEVTTTAARVYRQWQQVRVRGSGTVAPADIDGGAPINDVIDGAPVDGGPP